DQARRSGGRPAPPRILEVPASRRGGRGAGWGRSAGGEAIGGGKGQNEGPVTTGDGDKVEVRRPGGARRHAAASVGLWTRGGGAVLSCVNLPGHEARRLGEIVRRLTR